MNNDSNNINVHAGEPVPLVENESAWNGFDIDTLRMMRAKALLRREVGRVQMMSSFDGVRTRVNEKGMRGLLFDNLTIGRLKTVDYLLIGWRLATALLKYRRRSK